MAEENVTTQKEFQIFKKESMMWVDKLGLKGWDIEYSHKSLDIGTLATCSYNVISRSADLSLNVVWIKSPTVLNIKRAAFHEVMELLLARFDAIARDRSLGEFELEEEAHNIIRVFENIFYNRHEKKGKA